MEVPPPCSNLQASRGGGGEVYIPAGGAWRRVGARSKVFGTGEGESGGGRQEPSQDYSLTLVIFLGLLSA